MIDFGYGVILDTIDLKDIEVLRSWRNDWDIWRWCRQNDLISEYDQLEWFKTQEKNPSIKMYLIVGADSVRSIKKCGVCGFTSIDLKNRKAEFSLYIATPYQRQGYGKKALKTLITHGMRNLGIHSIWGETFVTNPAHDLFSKLGFKDEGLRREAYFKNGRFVDAYIFSILYSEWASNPIYNVDLRIESD